MSEQKYKDGTVEFTCDGGEDCEESTMIDEHGNPSDEGWSILRERDIYCPRCTKQLIEDGQTPTLLQVSKP